MARIKTTPMVRAALWALRVYLLVLLSLILLSFTRGCSKAQKNPQLPETPKPAQR
jgi:hypothetical protein